MRTIRAFIRGATIGAIAAYFFDPQMGRTRRAAAAEQFRKLFETASHDRPGFEKQVSQGTGAPTRDVQSGVAFDPPRSPWPPASEPTIRPVSAGGPFPPAID